MLSIQERLSIATEPIDGAAWQWACMLRCAVPGIVVSFDPIKQTCVVQPAIQEIFLLPPPATSQNPDPGVSQNIPVSTTLKPVEGCPIIMMRVPGWSMTFPIVEGTECLLISADLCIDGWWQNSGVSAQFDRRRHDFSDSFAMFGPWSQPNVLSDYSTTSMQIRSDDKTKLIDLAESGISIQAPLVTVMSSGGTAQPVMTQDFFEWFVTVAIPTLDTHGITFTPAPPIGSVTTVLEAE